MNITRCNNGHFYDAEKYTQCPHCNGGAMVDGAAGTVQDNAGKTMPSTPPMGGVAPAGGAATKPSPSTPPMGGAKPSTPPANNEVDDIKKTVGIFNAKSGGKQPVVGWLVCVEGPHYGEDFQIRMGRNFIGRANSMDIVLAKDNSVSRDKHSIIVYEPKGNLFIVQAGDSKELSYLNDSVILSPAELKPYDSLKIGACTLVFVPFCNDNFKWEEKKD